MYKSNFFTNNLYGKIQEPRSKCWKYFSKIYHSEDSNKDINDRRITEVKCTLCSPPLYTILKWCGSTTNMTKHLKCHSIDSDEDLNNEKDEEMELMGEDIMQKAADKLKKRVEKTHSALLVMLISCAFAFNVVSNPQFISFVQMLNPTYDVPSPYVLSHSYLDKEFMLVV